MSNCDFVAGGSLLDLAASKLALRAPARSAATALSQALDEGGPAGGIVSHRPALPLGQHSDVQTIFRHVDSAVREHLRIPSLLMRARAQATVRVWKIRLELQAHWRIGIQGGCGLPVATGRRS